MGYDTTAWTTAGNTLTIGGTSLYTNFFIDASKTHNYQAGYHEMIPILGHYKNTADSGVPNLGNGAEPATSFSITDALGNRAGDLIPLLWYIPDNIYIDEINSLEGADLTTGDTTRMHLMSFDFTSGATTPLSSGEVIANNSDTTNAGSEQIYLSNWTISEPSVSSGKALAATFEQDSINADYSANIIIKYHLV